MNVYRVPIALDPLLMSLGALLLETPVPLNKPVEETGNLTADLALREFSQDRPLPTSYRRVALSSLQGKARKMVSQHPGFEVRGCHYHPTGGGLGWHTNSDAPGWRVYVVRPLVEMHKVDSRLLHKCTDGYGSESHEVIDPRNEGYANIFETGPGTWHAIDAKTARMAVGLRVPREWALDLLRRASHPGTGDPGNATTAA